MNTTPLTAIEARALADAHNTASEIETLIRDQVYPAIQRAAERGLYRAEVVLYPVWSQDWDEAAWLGELDEALSNLRLYQGYRTESYPMEGMVSRRVIISW